jgi:hypothetical protein
LATLQALGSADGNPKAVVIPIALRRQLLPQASDAIQELAENLEGYCLSKAMDEARVTPLLNREEALKFLSEEDSEAEDGD